MLWLILFLFGIAVGSFLNVVILRYDGEHFLFNTKMIGGRSHCVSCKKTLRWFELVPIVSFLIQGGRCRRCKARLNPQYPIVEAFSGFIFIFMPLAAGMNILAAVLWVAVFEALLVMAVVDIRLGIIPDEINIFLGAVGIVLIFTAGGQENGVAQKLIGALIAAAAAGVFFAALIAITRGKGMGMGDLKLAIPLGLIFGWPNIIFVLMFSFIIGAAVGVLTVARGKNSMKGTLPFGPFLALGAATVFFWGSSIIGWYLSLMR